MIRFCILLICCVGASLKANSQCDFDHQISVFPRISWLENIEPDTFDLSFEPLQTAPNCSALTPVRTRRFRSLVTFPGGIDIYVKPLTAMNLHITVYDTCGGNEIFCEAVNTDTTLKITGIRGDKAHFEFWAGPLDEGTFQVATFFDCGITRVALPLGSDTSRTTCTDDQGWTHYSLGWSQSQYMFSINWAPDGTLSEGNAHARDNARIIVTFDTSATIVEGSNCATGAGTRTVIIDTWPHEPNEKFSIRYYPFVEFYYLEMAMRDVEARLGTDESTRDMYFAKHPQLFDPSVHIADTGIIGGVPLDFSEYHDTAAYNIRYLEIENFLGFKSLAEVWTACRSTALPIQFIAADHRLVDDGVLIEWEVAEDYLVHSYIIERTEDLINWTRIGSVHERKSQLAYLDRSLRREAWYRIRAIEETGEEEISPILHVRNQLETNIYPNPAHDVFTIVAIPGSVVDIFSAQGILAKSARISDAASVVDIKELPAGTYFVRLREGQESSFSRLVKQ